MSLKYDKKYLDIIEILGEQKLNRLYEILGSEKLSVAALKKYLESNRIKESLNFSKPISRIASENGVSKMTIYRYLRKMKGKH
jgi:DNA invertase Pin-like site-specific DNA recombinase